MSYRRRGGRSRGGYRGRRRGGRGRRIMRGGRRL